MSEEKHKCEGRLYWKTSGAAGPWQTGEPPKDGTLILGQWKHVVVVNWNGRYWEARTQDCVSSVMDGDPLCWARVNVPKEEE